MATRPVLAAALALFAGCATGAPAPDVAPELRPFVGHHCGELRIFGGAGATTVPMELLVEPVAGKTDTVRFVLVYGAGDEAQRRDYLLVLDDAATGRCHVDERNGIVLGSWLTDGELVSAFTVQGHTTIARYRAGEGGIAFALEALQSDRGASTGHGVTSHGDVVRQRAWLRRTAP